MENRLIPHSNIRTIVEIIKDIMDVEELEVINAFSTIFDIVGLDVTTKFKITDTKIKPKKTIISFMFMNDRNLQKGELTNLTLILFKDSNYVITNVNGENIKNPGNVELSFNILYEKNILQNLYELNLGGDKNEATTKPSNSKIE